VPLMLYMVTSLESSPDTYKNFPEGSTVSQAGSIPTLKGEPATSFRAPVVGSPCSQRHYWKNRLRHTRTFRTDPLRNGRALSLSVRESPSGRQRAGSYIDGKNRDGVGVLIDDIGEAASRVHCERSRLSSSRKRRANDRRERAGIHGDAESGDGISAEVRHIGKPASGVNR